MDFTKYESLVEKYKKNDCREVNFQNRILIPFLEELINDEYDVVDTSILYKNMKNIDREKFAGEQTPDVIITKKWKLLNKEKENPLIIIEVKAPTINNNKKKRDYAEKEVKEYLNLTKKYVILTDCIIWEIYDKDKENYNEEGKLKITDIVNLNKNNKENKEKTDGNKEVCRYKYNKEKTIELREKEWEKLGEKIKGMLKELE